jgi:hypothetical protein
MSRRIPTLRRALTLDPNLEDAAAQIVSLDTDAGNLSQAYHWPRFANRPNTPHLMKYPPMNAWMVR